MGASDKMKRIRAVTVRQWLFPSPLPTPWRRCYGGAFPRVLTRPRNDNGWMAYAPGPGNLGANNADGFGAAHLFAGHGRFRSGVGVAADAGIRDVRAA